tara:strand:+ start:244 stop:762 length:519 start_codon:yes stop_codon:yes gene_type:complete
VAQSFADLDRKLGRVVADLNGEVSRQGLARVGQKVQGEIDQAVSADIGDTSMSGWRRSGPIAITGTSRVISDHAVIVEPVGKAKGPMAVLERGRNQGNAGGMAGPGVSADGTTRRNANGSVRKTRARKAKRWNGTTQGKGTMGDASQAIKDKAPRLIAAEVHRALGKHLSGG